VVPADQLLFAHPSVAVPPAAAFRAALVAPTFVHFTEELAGTIILRKKWY